MVLLDGRKHIQIQNVFTQIERKKLIPKTDSNVRINHKYKYLKHKNMYFKYLISIFILRCYLKINIDILISALYIKFLKVSIYFLCFVFIFWDLTSDILKPNQYNLNPNDIWLFLWVLGCNTISNQI